MAVLQAPAPSLSELVFAGKSHIAPLVGEMLQRIQAEVARYERVISYWPSFGPSLEAAVCAALRTTTAAVSRQCGLIPMIGVGCLLPLISCFPFAGIQLTWDTPSHMRQSWPDLTHLRFVGIAAPSAGKTLIVHCPTHMNTWLGHPFYCI